MELTALNGHVIGVVAERRQVVGVIAGLEAGR